MKIFQGKRGANNHPSVEQTEGLVINFGHLLLGINYYEVLMNLCSSFNQIYVQKIFKPFFIYGVLFDLMVSCEVNQFSITSSHCLLLLK